MDKKTQHVEAALIATAAIVFVIFTVVEAVLLLQGSKPEEA